MTEKRPKGRPKTNLMEKAQDIQLQNSFYTVEEVAELLKVHPNSIRNFIREGRIKRIKFGQAVRIPKGEIEKLMKGEQ